MQIPDQVRGDRYGPLDSPNGHSYMAVIPFHRLTGGAFVRAPFFHWKGLNALRWVGRVPAVLWS